MRLQDLALASARVAIASEKASDDLGALLDKWFAKHLVNGIKLPGLRAMHAAGALDAFLECLATRQEADVIGVLRKVDAQNGDILGRTRADMVAHIRNLAAGRVEPVLKPQKSKSSAGKAKAPGKPKKAKEPAVKAVQTGGVYERSRL